VVATTSLGLEYQQGTDRPCDAPDVWCDFTETLEGLLVPIDDIAGRISPSIPCAKVKRTTALSVNDATNPFGIPVAWDSVIFDTDGMVDLTNSQFEIKPTRSGTYFVVSTMVASLNGVTTTSATLNIIVSEFSTSPFFSSGTSAQWLDQCPMLDTAGSAYYWRIGVAHIYNPSTFKFGYSVFVGSNASLILTATDITLSVYWISDVV
jgi:hypothetical protein